MPAGIVLIANAYACMKYERTILPKTITIIQHGKCSNTGVHLYIYTERVMNTSDEDGSHRNRAMIYMDHCDSYN